MTLRLLGTGAADGIPAFYGDCRVCRHAREHGGKDVRTRSSALVDVGLKIDLPPDTLAQLNRDRLTAKDWTAVLFTHSDDDHLAVDQLQYALHPFTDMDHLAFTIYGNAHVTRQIWDRYPSWPLEVVTTKSFCPFAHGDYVVTPIRAQHGCPEEDAHNFVVEKADRKLIYATDTGIWPDDTWFHLRGLQADLLVLECTDGFNEPSYNGHLNIAQCAEVVERLRAQNGLTPVARVVTTHHSHRGNATHAELEVALSPHSIEPGYDGMVIQL